MKNEAKLIALMHILFALTILLASSINPATAFTFAASQFQLPNIFNDFTSKISSGGAKSTFSYTHLEGNGQLWQATSTKNNAKTSVSVVIDPIASQLDFGIPWGYRANKRAISEQATIDMICDANPSHCLLTMGLDDHTHLPTLTELRKRMPALRYIVAPSCEKKLLDFGIPADQITVLDHGESCLLVDGASVTATVGALVGPPWQKRENGFLLKLTDNGKSEEDATMSIYYEPHADVVLDRIKNLRANIMVSPVTKQSLPAQVPAKGQYTLVYGGDRTLEIAECLGAQTIVPLGNGALDIEGPLAGLVEASGDVDEFESLVEQRNAGKDNAIRVAKATAGVPLTITV